MNKSETIADLAAALAKAQGEMPVLVKDSTGQVGQQKTRYASLDAVIDVISPVFAANGLAVVQFPVSAADRVGVETVITHSSGQWMAHEFTLPAQATAQGFGSGLSYARRYALMAVARIAPEDDDGAGAMPPRASRSAAPAEKAPPVPQRPAEGRGAPWIDPAPAPRLIDAEPHGEPATERQQRDFWTSATNLGWKNDAVHRFIKRDTIVGMTNADLQRLIRELRGAKLPELVG